MANPLLRFWYGLYTNQTPCEQIMEKEICRLGIRYRTQHPWFSFRPAAFTDFYFPDYSVVLEIDDPGHLKPKQIEKDRLRTKSLAGLGITVLRCTNQEVMNNPQEVLTRLKKALEIDGD